jgi:hypothetical protein
MVTIVTDDFEDPKIGFEWQKQMTKLAISGWWDVSLTQEEIARVSKAAHPSEVRTENYVGPWPDGTYGKRAAHSAGD